MNKNKKAVGQFVLAGIVLGSVALFPVHWAASIGWIALWCIFLGIGLSLNDE